MENGSISKKTILLVNTGSLKKKFIIQRLKKLGAKLIILNKEINWAGAYADDWIIADTFNHTEAISSVNTFIKNHPRTKIDGVLTFWEDDVLLTSKIVDRFNLIGIPYAVAKNARNKYLFREFCSQNGIRAPKHMLIKDSKDLRAAIKELTFPLVIKPAYGSSSAFVVKVDNKDELKQTYNFIQESISLELESALSDGLDVFVEEYIDGDEVDIDILLQNGKIKFYSIADNYNKNRGQFFVDSGQAIPSSLPETDQKDLIDMAEEALEKLGIQDGCIHFEAKSTKNGPVPIEINLRMGGDYVYSYIKGCWDVDLIESAAKIAVGQYVQIEKPAAPHKYIAGWDLHPEFSGILIEMNVNEELKKKKYLEEIELYKEVGDPVLLPPEGYENIGWLTVSGDNTLDASDNLKEALSFIQYKVAKFDEESSVGKTEREDQFSAAVISKDLLMQAARIEKVRKTSSKENQRGLFIGVTGNTHEGAPDQIGYELQFTTESIINTLRERGYRVKFFDFNNVTRAINDLRRSDVDLVFNAYEQTDNHTITRSQIAAILEALGIPFTGSKSLDLGLCQDKLRFKKLLSFHSIPTPKWDYIYDVNDKVDEKMKFPMIVKPGNIDNSSGITNESVVKNEKELTRQLKLIINDLKRPALVEEYIEGDEYHVSILGNTKENQKVLPLSRSIFKNIPSGYPHIFTFEAKWKQRKNSVFRKVINQSPPKNISPKLEALLSEIALDTYNILHCQDFGKVEIRVDKDDNPYVIDVDPSPVLSLRSELIKVAKITGLEYGDLIEEIIAMAVKRYQNQNIFA